MRGNESEASRRLKRRYVRAVNLSRYCRSDWLRMACWRDEVRLRMLAALGSPFFEALTCLSLSKVF